MEEINLSSLRSEQCAAVTCRPQRTLYSICVPEQDSKTLQLKSSVLPILASEWEKNTINIL